MDTDRHIQRIPCQAGNGFTGSHWRKERESQNSRKFYPYSKSCAFPLHRFHHQWLKPTQGAKLDLFSYLAPLPKKSSPPSIHIPPILMKNTCLEASFEWRIFFLYSGADFNCKIPSHPPGSHSRVVSLNNQATSSPCLSLCFPEGSSPKGFPAIVRGETQCHFLFSFRHCIWLSECSQLANQSSSMSQSTHLGNQ